MKKKQHHFILTVTSDSSRESARIAVLTAFAKRNPDGCEFDLKTERTNRLVAENKRLTRLLEQIKPMARLGAKLFSSQILERKEIA